MPTSSDDQRRPPGRFSQFLDWFRPRGLIRGRLIRGRGSRPINYWRVSFGLLLLGVGLAGLVLPFLQGILLLLLALMVLSADIRLARWLRLKLERRLPRLRRAARRTHDWLHRYVHLPHRRRHRHTSQS